MKLTLYTKLFLILGVFALISCSNDDGPYATPYVPEVTAEQPPAPNYTSGDADFSTYVAVGNSLTAGYADGALYIEGQEVSFPNILAQQFALAGGGSFTQPLMNDNLGGLLLGGNQIANNRFYFDIGSESPKLVVGTPTTEVSDIKPGPYNNMGVPGAKSYHLLASGYGNLAGVQAGMSNPYFVRMATSASTTVMEDALAMSPTFFSLWIGANDVLGYATSGGTGVDQNETGNTDPSTYGGSDITNVNVFTQVYSALLQMLVGTKAKGFVVNIPNVTDVPFFTTVPYNPIPMDAQTAAAVNNGYAEYNGGLALAKAGGFITEQEMAERTIHFQASATNPVVIEDESLTDLSTIGIPSYRQATPEDLLVLTAMNFIGTLADPNNPSSVNGVGVPLADQWVLVPEEQTHISNAITAFNTTINNTAQQLDIPMLDANAILHQIAENGLKVGSTTLTSDFVTGGAFSLDGVHPSPRGYAVLANAMIDAINHKYGSNLPKVNPIEYTGVRVK